MLFHSLLSVMEGVLFKYGPASANVAFLSGRHPRHVVLVGGLTDGLLPVQYAKPLAQRLEQASWSLVQTLLSSSHTGWGLASLDQDADELNLLARHLKASFGSQGIVIVGHSTGCQDAIRYAQRHRSDAEAASLLGAVLQAPVSDRDWLATQPGTAEQLARAEEMLAAGHGEEICFRAHDIDGAAITARRWYALAAMGGDDDYFSSDLTDSQLQEKFAALAGLPTLLLLSGADEYVPPSIDYMGTGRRLQAAIGASAKLAVVEGANHALNGSEEQTKAGVEEIVTFLSTL